MHPDEFSPTLFRLGGPALKIWDVLRYSTQDDLIVGGPRSASDKVVSSGATLERSGFDWVDDERIVTKKRKRSGSHSSGNGSSRQILYEFEVNLERLVKAIVDLRDLSSGSSYHGGRRASSARRSDIKVLRDEVGGLSIAIVLILVDYVLLLSVDSLVPWITERAALILQNSKLGVNERLDEVNRLVRGEYYRKVNPQQPPQRNKSKSSRNQPPRAPSPPRFPKGKFDGYRRNSISSESWQETSDASSYDDFRGRQTRHHRKQPPKPKDGYSATSSTVSGSEEFEEVPDLSYQSSEEDDPFYYYDETASATSEGSSGFDTLGARVDDRWSCDSWHEMNRRREREQPQRGRPAPQPRPHPHPHPHPHPQQPQPQRRQRDITPPPRFSQTKFFDARNMAGEQQIPQQPRTPRTPHTPSGFPFPPHQTSASKGFMPPPPPPMMRGPPPPQPRFAPGPPQRRFSHSYVPMPDGPARNNGPSKFPAYPPPPPRQTPITMVPGMQIPMPSGPRGPPPTPGFARPAVPPLGRTKTWPPDERSRRQTFGNFGYE